MLVRAYIQPSGKFAERQSVLCLAALQAAYSVTFLISRLDILNVDQPAVDGFKLRDRWAADYIFFHLHFLVVSLLRWACHGWIIAMVFDQYRRTWQPSGGSFRSLPGPFLRRRAQKNGDGPPTRQQNSSHPVRLCTK